MSTAARVGPPKRHSFQHEALLYAGSDEFLEGTSAFLRQAIAADEPALVVVDADKIEQLRGELGRDADRVHFADMADVGANPARIIPAWREFVDENTEPGQGIWGIGEPIWPGRTPAEMVECHRHEALLNLAFAGTPDFRLLCPYDTVGLDDDAIHGAHCNHPLVGPDGGLVASSDYRGLEAIAAPFADRLPDPPPERTELPFDAATVRLARQFTAGLAADAGLGGARVEDLVLAVDELATNSIRHAGGHGMLRIWRDEETLFCEVSDSGRIDDPLVGRVKPSSTGVGGYGMWLVQQLCDLVQVRTSSAGTVCRIHTYL